MLTSAVELVVVVEGALVLILAVCRLPGELALRPEALAVVSLVAIARPRLHASSVEGVVLEASNVGQLLGLVAAFDAG
jgi:hypothetical protein